MKRFTQVLSVFAMAAAVVSCENADMDDVTQGGGAGNTKAGAYVSVQVVTPSTRTETNVGNDKVDGDLVDATADESTVTDVMLVAFDKNHNYIGLYTAPYAKDADKKKFSFKVSPDAHRFFAIANVDEAGDSKLYNYIETHTNMWSDVTSVQEALTLANELAGFAESGDFPMVSAGEYGNALTSISESKLSTKEEFPTQLTINVDRLATKFSFYVPTTFVVKEGADTTKGTEGKIIGVKLTATNKSAYLYSYITNPQVSGLKGDYRIDPNMKLDASNITGVNKDDLPLTWIDNADFVRENTYDPFIGIEGGSDKGLGAECEYVLENTADADYFDSNNLTQAIVKAEYIPGVVVTAKADTNTNTDNGSKSWFAIHESDGTSVGTKYLTFQGVVAFYNAIDKIVTDEEGKTSGKDQAIIDKNQAILDKMDTQLNHILGITDAAKKKAWNDSDVTLATLDAVNHGGYVAATVPSTNAGASKEENYIVEYYQNGLNYYDVFIQHDSNQGIGRPGRWGMVHNNYYELTLASISAPGRPYIPDPTDPEIVDPENPTPEDPEPADKGHGYIDATIAVNAWTFWEQSADLGGADFEQ